MHDSQGGITKLMESTHVIPPKINGVHKFGETEIILKNNSLSD